MHMVRKIFKKYNIIIHTKLRGFPFMSLTNMVSQNFDPHKMADSDSSRRQGKTVHFQGMFVWFFIFYFQIIHLTICIS